MSTSLSLLRLCHLVSPALPVGAYNFSQGLEYAAHAGWVHDERSTLEWIAGVARHAIGTLDLPILLRMHAAWSIDDTPQAAVWSRYLLASRETAELRAEERHMGRALAKVLAELRIGEAIEWSKHDHATYALLFALAATRWEITADQTAHAYLWTWCENQVLAALKLLPLGQSAGQRMLDGLLVEIPAIAHAAGSIANDDIGVATPLHGMASVWHETQYSRLFRS